jgi:hypothetical protein
MVRSTTIASADCRMRPSKSVWRERGKMAGARVVAGAALVQHGHPKYLFVFAVFTTADERLAQIDDA